MKYALVVDDDKTQRGLVAAILKEHLGLDILEAKNGQECLEILQQNECRGIKLITLDLDMPVMTGLEILPYITKNYENIPVLVVTGTEDIENAATAIKLGALDFFPKPFKAERIIASARNALKISLLNKEVTRLERQSSGALSFADLIGADDALAPIINLAGKAARSNVPVLISGETGTGKEVFARAIHGEGVGSGKPFIAVNCGAIPENLVESTLFGHEKGSFTGAIHKALGKFREAEGGTIFLDEVGELSHDTQVKLLRVLQEQEIEPVGAGKSEPINVRILSATNRDLEHEVMEKRFREDLYFRLNVFPLTLPPLRMRMSDIPILTRHFIERFSAKDPSLFKNITEAAIEKLMQHSWPGNVRELENTISRSLILCEKDILDEGDINFFHTGSTPLTSTPTDNAGENTNKTGKTIPILNDDGQLHSLEEIELLFFNAALSHCDNNITKASKSIGIAKSTLYRKLNKTAA